jgi:hypothetical protein
MHKQTVLTTICPTDDSPNNDSLNLSVDSLYYQHITVSSFKSSSSEKAYGCLKQLIVKKIHANFHENFENVLKK